MDWPDRREIPVVQEPMGRTERRDCPEPKEKLVCLGSQEARETADSMDYQATTAKTEFPAQMGARETRENVSKRVVPTAHPEKEDQPEIRDREDKTETPALMGLKETRDYLDCLAWTPRQADPVKRESVVSPVAQAETDCPDPRATAEFQVETD